ncbi:MAG TPA: transglutaminase family protein [Gammaproteobacteria bacterium]|nr:transglutaminase family protein [Gammaproteobacteria bacterium]
MSIHVALNHWTEYRYDRPVRLSPQTIRLRPAPHCRTPIESYALRIAPQPHFINWLQDPFGNFVGRVVFPEPVRRFAVTVDLVADMTVINPFDFFVEEYAERYPFDYPDALARQLAPYRHAPTPGPRLADYLATVAVPHETRTIDFLVELNQRLSKEVAYTVRLEPGVQSCEQTLERGVGSCRDSAYLLVQIARHLGLAARFASGSLVQLKSDVAALDGPSGPEADFTDLHAWAEIFLPGAGWIGLDPTSGLLAGEGHIPLCCTPEPAAAAPIEGASDPAEVEFAFHNEVQRLRERPRVTLPYSQAQWEDIDALGAKVDARLQAADVRLTQGGEPTFVSIDDMDGAEWNTGALGPHKRQRAEDLLRRLRARFAPGGMLHYGQGKWYPGEPLPRWSLGCIWRSDGQPVVKDDALLADPTVPGDADAAAAQRLIAAIAAALAVDPAPIAPAYEDLYYYLWVERRLPDDVGPGHPALQADADRARLAKLLEPGLGTVTGYLLPLQWQWETAQTGRYVSGPWHVRRGHIYLLPGDSPMGLRLPLDSLPAGAGQGEAPVPADPWGPLRPLPAPPGGEIRLQRPGVANPASPDPSAEPPAATALCVEPRNGVLHVFLPPTADAAQYLQLVHAVLAAAAAEGLAVALEGYEPPPSPQLRHFHVTPDPGVIEVNVQPASDWQGLRTITEGLYEDARLARLGAEKFMLDGRHTGTGGGNHVTLGSATPADSPFLRRPALLQSLITYWQHHPSLSYLFSGLFVGPTSQAPRLDEARTDSLYELEIAFGQLTGALPEDTALAPWLVDRLLRHLLIDVTGNTHRAEFCIDKLYSPDSATGRLGLLELRAFEMPPHPHMSLVQMLLVRALIARFWDQPYRGRLVRWGTDLHDRFMLEHFVRQDFHDVLEELRGAGFAFEDRWFEPFFEFRFPVLGQLKARELTLELRQAIEPWHVLGEEATGGGTARYVDSSVERLQVRLTGAAGDRYHVSCNGRPLPLHQTGRVDERVCGVRFKAWQPPSALHPRIPAQTPLTFDLHDRWNGRAIAGCRYYVAHPAGRNYERFPVNASEAEARRLARFERFGHTPGRHDATHLTQPQAALAPEHPYTLDLRRHPVLGGS